MSEKVFTSKGVINWIPENTTGDIPGTHRSIDVMKQLLEEEGNASILVDLSKAKRPNSEQRQIIIRALRSHLSKINRIALFGETPLMKAVAHFIINATGYDSIKFFENRSQAERWLESR